MTVHKPISTPSSKPRALEAIVDEVIAANAKNVAEFKAGNEKALNGLVGQIMKASKGKANPQQVNDLLRAKLST
ncbi:MAG: Asp-tRNA(Asn)/Glu-tRNA(Gln) amidotransferase subunit GatB [Pseudomonadota bacterium]